VIDYQRDLLISGDFDRVVLLLTSEISDYHIDLFLSWWLISGECFTHWNSVHRDRIRTTTTTFYIWIFY